MAIVASIAAPTLAQTENTNTDKQEQDVLEEVVVVGKSLTYANTSTSDEMFKQQSSMTSALSVIDNLPGILINEGDTFGSDDWSTTVSIRGFQLSLDSQQVGITIDGIANGNSNYGGGAKANRYIDTENLAGVDVSQGTADIASRSNEALGGTLDFKTINPGQEQKMITSYSQGSFDAQKYFIRYETGEVAKDTYAWLSFSNSSNTDFITGSAENARDHFAAKFISDISPMLSLEGYFSWDDVHEDNYQRVTLTEFERNPTTDGLLGEWTGIPYIDQVYRQGWSTLRENTFAYVEANASFGQVDVTGNVYYHNNKGRGDWVPPYLVDITENNDDAHSELTSGNTVYGGAPLGNIYFVNASGQSLSPMEDCVSSIAFPYGGAGAEYDPLCYEQGAIPVGSYRHTHYEKTRVGFNGDLNWETMIAGNSNILRAGIWYDDYERDEHRDWHKIIDSKSSYQFDHTPYWVQYDRTYPVTTTMLYLEDSLQLNDITLRAGVKKFLVELERQDKIGNSSLNVESDSDLLFSAGVVWKLPMTNLELFAGYAENFAAIKDEVLEQSSSNTSNLKPETAENMDLGIRYTHQDLNASITVYNIDFSNRLTFIPPGTSEGINFLDSDGDYINTGGITSSGVETALTYYPNNNWSIYLSYTLNESEYSEGSLYPAGGELASITDNTVFGSVEDMAVISFDWLQDKYSAGLSTKWVGERWMDAFNTQRIDDYIVSDLYVAIDVMENGDILKDASLRFTVNNLFDESYIGGVAGGWGGWIGAPRTASINLKASF